VRWDNLVADLEGQLDHAEVAERAAEIEEHARAESGRLSLVDRLRGAQGESLRVEVSRSGRGEAAAGWSVRGRLARVGDGWLLIAGESGAETVVMLASVTAVYGLSRLSAAPGSMTAVEARLSVRSVLRSIARDRAAVRVRTRHGVVIEGTIDRVGADFFEVATHSVGELRRSALVRELAVVAVDGVAAVERLP